MHPDRQRRVQRYGWDKAATFYEPYWREPLEPAQCLLLEWANLQPGERCWTSPAARSWSRSTLRDGMGIRCGHRHVRSPPPPASAQ